MKKLMFLIGLMIFVIGNANVTFAKETIVEATGNYFIDLRIKETFESATEYARMEARRKAIEQAGVYVQSYSVLKDLELEFDEVKTVSAQILKVLDEEIDSKSAGKNLLEIIVNIKASVDDEINEEILKTIAQDKSRIEEVTRRNKELEQQYNELKAQLEQIKSQADTADAAELAALNRAVAQNYDKLNAILAFQEGNNAFLIKNYQGALTAYNQAIKLNSAWSEAYNNRGTVFVELSQYQSAMQDFQAAVKLNNDNPQAHNNLGSIYFIMKNYDDAVAEFTQALKLNSNFAEVYFNRGIAYYVLGRYQEAMKDAKRFLKFNPDDVDAKDLYNEAYKRSR